MADECTNCGKRDGGAVCGDCDGRAGLEQRIAQLETELGWWKQLCSLAQDGERLIAEDGAVSFAFKSAVMGQVAQLCRVFIDAVPEAKNYCELWFDDEKGKLGLIIQRPEGMTPTERAERAEAERDALRLELAALKGAR